MSLVFLVGVFGWCFWSVFLVGVFGCGHQPQLSLAESLHGGRRMAAAFFFPCLFSLPVVSLFRGEVGGTSAAVQTDLMLFFVPGLRSIIDHYIERVA